MEGSSRPTDPARLTCEPAASSSSWPEVTCSTRATGARLLLRYLLGPFHIWTHLPPEWKGKTGLGVTWRRSWPARSRRRAVRGTTAHDEVMGESCERCGRPGKRCSIHDPLVSGKWKTLTLCDQCYGAIRQTDVRACKWLRRYCAPRNPATPISKTNH
jgi:hypothetical protein